VTLDVGEVITALREALAQPEQEPMTEERLKEIWYATQNIMGWYSFQEIARATEAAHNIKEGT
jgi:hypothetical protein